MKFEIITLFPDYFVQSLKQSLLGKAVADGLVEFEIVDLRKFATDKHRTVDDTPFGGGGGMVLKIEPIDKCLASLGYEQKANAENNTNSRIVLTSAAGETFTQRKAIEYSGC
ncbi:MAG: tRNA (guanosine(37)-N1)-methyltransferase TrmD, partial [candidate division Zixibacteria bacterium]|nr:tRNA (guanosine(37)-N1)-methyltransferase TrmD [candidate division Zixibacteria bacterium]